MKRNQTRSVRTMLVFGLLLLALPAVGYTADSDSNWTDPATGLTWARQDNGVDVY
jgi:hypothetical protein